MKNKLSIVFVVILIITSAHGIFAKDINEWHELETDHFIIMHHNLDESTLSMIAEEAENTYDKVTSDLKYHPDNKTVIRIGPEEKDQEDGWEGSYGVDSKTIDLQCPTQRMWYFFQDYESYIQEALIHEFTHHILSDGYKLGLPDWLNEGIATYEAKKKIEDFAGYRKFRTVASKNELLPLADMWTFYLLLEDDEIPLAYVESYTVVEYTVNTYGPDTLVNILIAQRDNPDMHEVIKDTLDVSYEDFELGWMNYVKEKYGEPSYNYYFSIIFYIIVWILLLKIGKQIWVKTTKK